MKVSVNNGGNEDSKLHGAASMFGTGNYFPKTPPGGGGRGRDLILEHRLIQIGENVNQPTTYTKD